MGWPSTEETKTRLDEDRGIWNHGFGGEVHKAECPFADSYRAQEMNHYANFA